jgi:hypothetical protein
MWKIDTAGDGFFATLDGPARAIRCACAISQSVCHLGISVRAGLHTGECGVIGEKVGGMAVHTRARVAGLAEAGEVLVASTVKDLVAGSGIDFQSRGAHTLKGIPGKWNLFAVRQPTASPWRTISWRLALGRKKFLRYYLKASMASVPTEPDGKRGPMPLCTLHGDLPSMHRHNLLHNV